MNSQVAIGTSQCVRTVLHFTIVRATGGNSLLCWRCWWCGQVEAEEQTEISEAYQVSAVPFFLFFKVTTATYNLDQL